jgi:hypothetical protein
MHEISVQAEILNRRGCRRGLPGVLVQAPGTPSPVAIRSTIWVANGCLIVLLEDGTEWPADDLLLRSRWPVTCCLPETRHRFNRA